MSNKVITDDPNWRGEPVPQAWIVLREELPKDTTKTWKLLSEYSKIPKQEIEPHLRAVRQKAYDIYPYPCIGQWHFLDSYFTTRPDYHDIIQRIRAGDAFLDAGTCFGNLLRELTHDGAPASRLWGFDLNPEFIKLGYELFRDKDAFNGHFVTGDVLNPRETRLAPLERRMDIIYAGSFFHLFPWEQQVEIGERLIRFFKPDAKRPLLIGRQAGWLEPTPHPTVPGACAGYTKHNVETFRRLWEVIGERTGTKWQVEGYMQTLGKESDYEGLIYLHFVVTPA